MYGQKVIPATISHTYIALTRHRQQPHSHVVG